ncbi:nucleotide sugar dehydrogenase [Alienimonas sp. DA493]|uniref:nucleotide sugar dehydrogenase n=1 Tax=Alienimonas sp. DA493 TaxID=3373605 RepID=UPI0037541980
MSAAPPSPAAGLRAALQNRTARVGVIGLGYVGLPLLDAFVGAGFKTIGFDTDRAKVDALRDGRSYIKHVPGAKIAAWLRDDAFEPTDDFARLNEPDVLLICVPTPLTDARDPDLSYVEGSARAIAKVLRPGQLVALESTTYPGTTRDVLLPILAESGLTAGEDYFLAYSPEREDPGNPDYTAAGIPKVVGGLDEVSGELARLLYEAAVVKVIPVGSPEVAEACKILENTYRAVNIALVNELKVLLDRMHVDVWEVIEAAKTKPFGFQAFYPGPGLGGHCIPIDPFYLTWLARRQGLNTRFIELAGEVNTSMPEYVVGKVIAALNDATKPVRGSKICVLGLAYKKNVDDHRESPSFELLRRLGELGAELSYHDPHIPRMPRGKRNYPDPPDLVSETLAPEFLKGLDCVLIATDHDAVDYETVVKHAPLVIDSRGATRGLEALGTVVKA